MSTPSHWDGLVPLAQVLTHARPAYGGDTWDEALAVLHADPAEAQVIADLAASVTGADQQVFDSPVRVCFDEEDQEWRLGNGMHRIATAVLLGHTQIRCCTRDDHGPDTEYVEVYYRLPGDWPDDIDHDEIAFAAGWLRSFPLPDGTWVETDMFSQTSGVMYGMWLCPHRHADALIAALAARSPAFEVVSHRCLTGAEWDAETDAVLAGMDTHG